MHFIKPQIDPYYHVGLGKVIHSKRQLKAELREHNLIEVGNEWKAAGVKRPNIGRDGGGSGIDLSRAERLVREKYNGK
jgi:hypothetical protein